MQLRQWFWIALVFPIPSYSQMVSQVDTKDREEATAIQPRMEVPFKLYQDYLIVAQGSVGTLEGLNLLIDTGANVTSIDRRIARKLGLKGQDDKLVLVNQLARVERVVLPSLQVGSFRAESILGIVQNLSFVDDVVGIRIDAIVGLDFLSQSSFAIDYKSKKMIFGPTDAMSL